MQANQYFKTRCLVDNTFPARLQARASAQLRASNRSRWIIKRYPCRKSISSYTQSSKENESLEVTDSDHIHSSSGVLKNLKNVTSRKGPPTVRAASHPQSRNILKDERTDITAQIVASADRGSYIRPELTDVILERKIKPQLPHYEALILENCSTFYGSALNVRRLLEEATTEGIALNRLLYTASLKVLAIHPDPQLLAEVLESCASSWVSLDEEMQHLVVTSYVRSDQLDLAYVQIQKINKEFGLAQPWIYVLLMQALVEHGDWDAIARICYELHDNRMQEVDLPFDFWSWILAEASKADEPWVTNWVWNLWVERMWIKPDMNTIQQVANIAAKHGLPKLAESAAHTLKFVTGREKDQHEIRKETKNLIYKAYATVQGKPPPRGVQKLQRGGARWSLFPDAGEVLGSARIDPWTALGTKRGSRQPYPRVRRHFDEWSNAIHKSKVTSITIENREAGEDTYLN